MNYDPSIFLAPNGRKLTTGLFFDYDRADSDVKPHFHLKDWKKVYVEVADPTEYDAAMALIGDWEHWNVLRNNPTLKPIIDGWAKEVEIKLRSEAIKSLISTSKGERGQTAAKWLAEAGFRIEGEKRDKRKKDEKATEEAVKSESLKRVAEDMERLGLKVVGGGA